MKSLSKTIVVILACLTCSGMALSQAGELIFSQTDDGQSAYGPSELWPVAGINSEVADDFEISGNIDRVYA